jgi:hypothetical protein
MDSGQVRVDPLQVAPRPGKDSKPDFSTVTFPKKVL